MSTGETTPTDVEVTIEVAASPAEVWPYFINVDLYVAWMGRSARLRPEPGGEYAVEMADGFAATGTYLRLEPPTGLTFTWGFAPGAGQAVLTGSRDDDALPPGSTTVEVSLVATGSGTVVRLIHRGLPDEALRDGHRVAWRTYLDRLAVVAAGGDPGPDPHS